MIYRFVYGPEGRAADLYRYLSKAHRQQRPPEVDDRQTFGHWKADLRILRRDHGKASLTSMIERQSRLTILLPNPDRQPKAPAERIGQAWQGLPEGSCRTVTFDRGTEFAAYTRLTKALGTEAYFCDPYSPWQKGVVENANGRIRRFLPGERNLAKLNEPCRT
ncbi:MAG: IS30 family transposase [Geminicoccaceae bacterium]